MIEIKQATVARAIDILRGGPMTAAQFAAKMWPERTKDHTPGERSRAGHPLLRQLAQVGYVQRVGDLWMLRLVGTADGLRDFPVATAVGTADGLAVGLPVALAVGPPVGLGVAPAVGAADRLPERVPNEPPRNEAERRADLDRLHRLVAFATEPVATVTHDAVLGNIEIRAWPLDELLEEACAWTVLQGRSQNVYPPVGGETAEMLVALTPVESARALYLRWQQSGRPPELLNERAWLVADDGLIAGPWAWMPPEYTDWGVWLCERTFGAEQIRRQREGAGLA